MFAREKKKEGKRSRDRHKQAACRREKYRVAGKQKRTEGETNKRKTGTAERQSHIFFSFIKSFLHSAAL